MYKYKKCFVNVTSKILTKPLLSFIYLKSILNEWRIEKNITIILAVSF